MRQLTLVYRFSAECNSTLGLGNGSLPDAALNASSAYADHGADKARLDGDGGWLPRYKAGLWLEVALNSATNITAIATQGYSSDDYWTKLYRLESGLDGNDWQLYEKVRGIFRGALPLSPGFPTHQSQWAPRQQYARPTNGTPEVMCCCHGDME